MIKDTINQSQFIDSFTGDYKNNFSYHGKIALYEYLEQLSDDIGEDVELDPIAFCCEYSEYDSALECAKDYGYDEQLQAVIDSNEEGVIEGESEDDALEWLQNQTQVIEFVKKDYSKGLDTKGTNAVIIQQF